VLSGGKAAGLSRGGDVHTGAAALQSPADRRSLETRSTDVYGTVAVDEVARRLTNLVSRLNHCSASEPSSTGNERWVRMGAPRFVTFR
jgi:hypothetical protein